MTVSLPKRVHSIFAATSALLLLIVVPVCAKAQIRLPSVFDLLGGGKAVNDLGAQVDESIDHAQAAVQALILSGNVVVRERLNQIDAVVTTALDKSLSIESKTNSDILGILEKAKRDIDKLESKAFDDVNQVVWNIRCQGRKFVISDLGTALGRLGRLIGTNTIYVTPPFRRTGLLGNSKDVEFQAREQFYITYVEIRDYLLKQLSDAREDDPADPIVATYEFIAEYAKLTQCFVPGDSRYIKEYIDYYGKAQAWTNVLNVEIAR